MSKSNGRRLVSGTQFKTSRHVMGFRSRCLNISKAGDVDTNDRNLGLHSFRKCLLKCPARITVQIWPGMNGVRSKPTDWPRIHHCTRHWTVRDHNELGSPDCHPIWPVGPKGAILSIGNWDEKVQGVMLPRHQHTHARYSCSMISGPS